MFLPQPLSKIGSRHPEKIGKSGSPRGKPRIWSVAAINIKKDHEGFEGGGINEGKRRIEKQENQFNEEWTSRK